MATREEFARALLTALGAPASDSNVKFLVAWQARENTKAANNPLATTWNLPGATTLSGNPAGVKNYPTFLDGINATAKTLTHGYNTILGALRAGDGNAAAHASADLHKWSGGGYTSIDIGGGGGGDIGDLIPSPGDIVGGVVSLPGDVVSGVTGIPGLLTGIGTGWVKDLATALLPVFLTLIFTVAGFGFLAMGVHRLTGHNPVDVFKKAKSAADTAALAAAI